MKYADLRFTDPRGKWQHVTIDITTSRRGHLQRRHHVRWLLDRRLEGDPRVRHAAHARPGERLHRPVLCRDDAGAGLRHARAADRRALQSRPALDRQEGRGPGQVHGHRRHGVLRAGSRVLHLRRREIRQPAPTTPASSSTPSSSRPIPTPTTKAAISATISAPRRATSRCPRRTPRRTCARKCSAPWRAWASRSRSTTMRSARRSMNSACGLARW